MSWRGVALDGHFARLDSQGFPTSISVQPCPGRGLGGPRSRQLTPPSTSSPGSCPAPPVGGGVTLFVPRAAKGHPWQGAAAALGGPRGGEAAVEEEPKLFCASSTQTGPDGRRAHPARGVLPPLRWHGHMTTLVGPGTPRASRDWLCPPSPLRQSRRSAGACPPPEQPPQSSAGLGSCLRPSALQWERGGGTLPLGKPPRSLSRGVDRAPCCHSHALPSEENQRGTALLPAGAGG